eukprot:353668-Chlamydomonas_euryale.AAC.3
MNWLTVDLSKAVAHAALVPGLPYTSVPASRSVDGCQLLPAGTWRTRVHPPLSMPPHHCAVGGLCVAVLAVQQVTAGNGSGVVSEGHPGVLHGSGAVVPARAIVGRADG